MRNERDDPAPEACSDEGDEEREECNQEISITVGYCIRRPCDLSMRPVDPKSDMNVVFSHH
jgi:hypothetical protein